MPSTRILVEYADFQAQVQTHIIFKTKDFFWIFLLPFEIYIKWRIISKNKESPSLSISVFTDSKRGLLLKLPEKPYFRTAFGNQPVNG